MKNATNNLTLTKNLAITGTVLLWIPILFMIVLSVIGTAHDRVLRFDYLIPAELFPVELVGALLLLWASLRARLMLKTVCWGLAAVVIFLAGGQTIAVLSGLASGETEPVGLIWALVLSTVILYSLSIILLGIAGVQLIRRLYITKSQR